MKCYLLRKEIILNKPLLNNQGELLFTALSISVLLLLIAIFVINLGFTYKKKRQRHDLEMNNLRHEFEQEILKAQIETHEQVQLQLSQEIHDNVGQLLSSTKMMMTILQRQLKEVPDIFFATEETLSKAINELKSLSRSMNQEWLEQFDLVNNLETEIHRINNAGQLSIGFRSSGPIPLASNKQIILFRIIQETIQNTIKHAAANMLNIVIDTGAPNLLIEVKDNGKGFDTNVNSNKGIGILNIKNRVRLLGGSINWSSVTGQGTTIQITIPV